MLRHHIEGCKWGCDPIEDGIQINLFHEKSENLFVVPFQGTALEQLVKFAWEALPEEARRRIQAESAGVIIAQPGDVPPIGGNGHHS